MNTLYLIFGSNVVASFANEIFLLVPYWGFLLHMFNFL